MRTYSASSVTIPTNGVILFNTAGAWVNGNIEQDGVLWYKFNVEKDETYYVWWNDKDAGDDSQQADIYVEAYYANRGPITNDKLDRGWDNPLKIESLFNSTVYLKITHYENDFGSFRIVYKIDDDERP